MAKTKSNTYTAILNTIMRFGPLTSREIQKLTGYVSVPVRIAEFNRYFNDISIESTKTRPKKYFVQINKIVLDNKKLYPGSKHGDYTLRRKVSQ